MSNRLLRTLALLAFTTFSTAALADDPPARVGRIALAQGQVSISSNVGAPWAAAQVNWPVTSQNTITTAPGARTELRIGSTSVRLDGGSALEVSDLDDDYLHLRLQYGSVSVRVVNGDVLGGFELATPQARVRMLHPGRIRVDAEREPDTSVVQVFDGDARVEGGGTELLVRAGRRAEVRDDDVLSAQATRDAFDDWSAGRDQYEDRSLATRYVPPEMTGYEDLDRYGSWSTDAEYGSLWLPSVGPDWVPYRDGSWTWIAPWGWTWIDNAPWGYAPFHYGRWLRVHNRWAWAPGRHDRHPVWAPALVGWVGGPGLNLTFRGHNGPAQGWFPLSPHDRFEPWYRAPEAHLRWWNRNVRPDQRRDRDHDRGHRPEGLTVVPHDAFGNRNRVEVPRVPHGAPVPAPGAFKPGAAPPAPLMARERDHRRDDGNGRFDRGQHRPVLTAPPALSVQPQPGPQFQPRPQLQPGPQLQVGPFPGGRHDGREVFEDGRRLHPERGTPPPVGTAIASPPNQQGPVMGTVIASPPNQHGPAPGTAIASPPNQFGPGAVIGSQAPFPPQGFGRHERSHRGDGEFEHHRGRDPRQMQPQAIAAPPPPPMAAPPAARPPMAAPPAAPPAARPPMPMAPPPMAAQPMPAPPSAAMARPMPAAAPPPPAAAVQSAPQQRGEERRQGGEGGRERGRQMER